MNPFDAIAGHARPLALLRGMLDRDRLHHALIFEGPAGVGKATVARALAAALLCERAERPCGACDACRKVATGRHPDVFRVSLLPKAVDEPLAPPAEDPDNARKQILVKQIRHVAHLAGVGPRLGSRRVFVFDPADAMHPPAQNALLKTLEEPPGSTVLILVASRPHLLLSTVRSRSFTVRFSALTTVELADWLEARGTPAEEARARAALAEGRPGRALELDVEALLARREHVLAALEALATKRSALRSLGKMAAPLAGKTDVDLAHSLDLLEGLLRDAARHTVGESALQLTHADLAERVRRLGQALGAARAAALVRAAERLRADLRFNVNRTLIAETLLAGVAGGPLPPE